MFRCGSKVACTPRESEGGGSMPGVFSFFSCFRVPGGGGPLFFVRPRVSFYSSEYLDLIVYVLKCTLLYQYGVICILRSIPATYFCCCCCCCCSALPSCCCCSCSAAACCCCSSSCAGWQNLLLWFIASDSSVFFPFIQTRFTFNVPLGSTVAFLQRRFCTYNTYHIIHPRQLRACAEPRRALARRGGAPHVNMYVGHVV